MPGLRAALIWAGLAAAIAIPIIIAATSPLLAWRGAVYIVAGFAGILGLALILIQPLLVGGYLPGLPAARGRKAHRFIGASLILSIVVHVVGLWITSPPDVIDALLFDSPTPFSNWGVIAMWAAFAAAFLAAFRRSLPLRPRHWRLAHTALALIVVTGTVAHALLIEGTMGPISKLGLCALALAATAWVVVDLRSWTLLTRRRNRETPERA